MSGTVAQSPGVVPGIASRQLGVQRRALRSVLCLTILLLPQVALYDTPGVTSAVRNREHGARVQGAWQVAQHCGVVLFMVDAARQVGGPLRCSTS